MAIPNSQLDTWSRQGSITQSASTYASVKNALESANALYKDKSFEVFLQGSYGNDTNIHAESDVDVVIRLDAVFRGDIDSLSNEEKTAYHNLPNATYDFIKKLSTKETEILSMIAISLFITTPFDVS